MAMMDNVSIQTNVYQSEEYIRYVLKSIYDFPRQIIIIDGAYDEKMPSQYSTDNTQKIIESFPDPDKKIIYEKTFSKTQKEQRTKAIKYLDQEKDEWVFLVDDDEVYKIEDLNNLKKFLIKQAKKDNYWIGSYTFLGSFQWCRYITSPRLFRVKPGMEFIGSNSLTWNFGKEKYKGILTIPDVLRYHYSYVRNNNRLDIRKIQTSHSNYPYKKHGRFFCREDIYPIKFDGEHPEIMKDHPYAKIVWHPTQSDMKAGPRVKPKITDPEEKKEILAWDEYYKPFTVEDYEEHIKAWKGICHIIARLAPDKGARILEIGSGTGMMSIYLSKMSQEFYCVGFDNNSKQIQRAKNLALEVGAGAKFACRDIFSLDLKKVGVYHVVFSQGLLEHFSNIQIKEALEIMLKIGRIVVFSVPIDKFPHKSRGDERLLSDSFWRKMVSRYQLIHFSMFAKDTQIIVAIKRRYKEFKDNLRWEK